MADKRTKGPASTLRVKEVMETLVPHIDDLPNHLTTSDIIHALVTLAAAHVKITDATVPEEVFLAHCSEAFSSIGLAIQGETS